MPKAYSYLRFSTPEQSSGDSTRRQSTAAIEWCKRKGIELDQALSFRDLGRSGFTGANFREGALGAFFDAAEAGIVEKGSYLVIEALDRFSRENPMAAADRLFRLVRLGITLVTTDDGQEYSAERLSGTDPSAMLLLVVKMTQAHLESVRKSELVGKAWRQKKALARTEQRPLTPRCPEWLELRDGRFVERPERVAIVRRVFQETNDGAGRREIVRRLNAEGIPPFRGGKGWHTSSVAKVIQGRAVLGEYQPHTGTHRARNRKPDGDPILDFYPSIIDEVTYSRAQEATQGRRQRSAGRKGNAVHLLQGIARCASCEGAMHLRNHGAPPKGGIYLVCSSHERQAGCDNARRWRVDRLEPSLLTALGFVDAQAFSPLDDATPVAVERVTVARVKLEAANTRRKRWGDVLDDPDSVDDDEAKARYSAAAAEVKALKKELKAAETEAARLAADPGMIARLTDAATLSRQIEEADAEARRALRIRLSGILRELVERVECGELGAVMVLKPRLGPRRLEGVAPFTFRRDDRAVWSALLEADADEATQDAFLGW
ncbi:MULTISPECIES: recombinase family protein [unclassified Mesorhizobium]|uniref:recombinase family protein n=1 Tax=unclassified Mesorhizobium TaxID=325217 RepID=UPI0010935F03|nr:MULTISPECIES: recombinase family protein [unclassified Mesorhizobium]TGS40699.1 recombinase family protein [Mesorhizobium sp. M8A.F.Ca.ET.182.01.1.1]TGS78810.1 recombinase family protein [Mesorhizobium sp. M8A.F.Ca.ET.181.01.1.1]